MKFAIPALCCSCIIGVAAWAGAQDKPMDKPMGKEMKVTGCVAAGADADHFVLNDATMGGGDKAMKADMKPMSYALMGGNLKPHVGHKVEVTGTITDVSTGTLRVKQEPGKPGPDNKVVVKAQGKEATVETDRPVTPGSPPAMKTDQKQTLPVRRVKVDTVKMVSETCG